MPVRYCPSPGSGSSSAPPIGTEAYQWLWITSSDRARTHQWLAEVNRSIVDSHQHSGDDRAA